MRSVLTVLRLCVVVCQAPAEQITDDTIVHRRHEHLLFWKLYIYLIQTIALVFLGRERPLAEQQ